MKQRHAVLVVLLLMDGKEKSDSEMALVLMVERLLLRKFANDDVAVDENESQKRVRKMTVKRVDLLFKNMQKTKKQKLNQVYKI